MMTFNSWNSIIDDHHYQQCNHYIQSILESGLLLDEDLQVLSEQYDFNYDKLRLRTSFSLFETALNGIWIASTTFIINQFFSIPFLIASASPIILLASTWTGKFIRKRRQMGHITITLENIKKILILNKRFVEYLRERIITSQSHDTALFTPYTLRIKEVFHVLIESEIQIMESLKTAVGYLCKQVPSIHDSYSYLDQINLEMFKPGNSIKDAEECIRFYQKFSGLFILFTSHSLSCLGLTLCPSLWTVNTDLTKIFNDIVPKVNNVIVNSYNIIKTHFNSVKYSLNEKAPNKISKLSVEKFSTKFQNELHRQVMKGSIFFEKAQNIFRELEQAQNSEKVKLLSHLEVLRDTTLDYYENLVVLYELCKVEAFPRNQRKNQEIYVDQQKTDEPEEQAGESKSDFKVLYSDTQDGKVEPSLDDEIFEMDVSEYEPFLTNNVLDIEEDSSRKFASLMVKELKNSLKADQRFLAAREKRGIVDEELLPKNQVNQDESSSSQFENNEPVWKYSSTTVILPPPMPSRLFIVDDSFSSETDDNEAESDLLKAVRSEFSRRNITVDVIGDTTM